MLSCIQANSDARTVRIRSSGGRVQPAMQIGDVLAKMDADLIIDRQCSSSCLNYLIPVARSVTLSADDMLLSHGGIDPALVATDDTPASLADIAARQADYLRRHGIPKGWVMYRTAADNTSGLSRFMGPLTRPAIGTVRYIAFEAPMFESCLPDLVVRREGKPAGLPDAREAYTAFKALPSRTARCVEPATE